MPRPGGPRVDVRRATDRFTTRTDGVESRHAFSFGDHYDPTNVSHGLLVAHNDETVAPATGFGPHPHHDTEIVTWVLRGSLVHEDSAGNRGVIHPGLAQRMSAGTGIRHSERNDDWRPLDRRDTPLEPAHFVQMWLPPDEPGLTPSYEQRDVTDLLDGGELLPLVSGRARHRDEAAIRIHNSHATLHVARPAAGGSIELPEAPYLHLYVAEGTVALEGVGQLDEGDAVRFTATGGHRLAASADAQLLVWEMHADARRG